MSEPVFAPPPADGGEHVGSLTVAEHPRPPQVGDLSFGWRAATAIAWIAVILAMAAVWNASVQLGLPTWWLGPRSTPQPRIVQFLPFFGPVLMLLAAINQVTWLPRFGLATATTVAAIAVGDVGRMTSLAVVEFSIAAAAAVFSLVSFSGLYRRAAADR